MPKPVTGIRPALITMLVGALLALLASFVLSIEALELAKNPDSDLACNINIVFNCATVAQDATSELLGFPNSFIGMMALPVIVTIAVALLGGASFPKWFLRAMWCGALAGIVFAGWMLYVSFFVIQALCPWCLLTDVGMLLIAFGAFRYMARTGRLAWKPEVLREFSVKGYDLMVLIAVMVVIVAGVVLKYGDSLFG
jgi:uncharacterized membrane protein